jgi:hypothetical protein
MATHYIGGDVDSRMTNLAVDSGGRIVREFCVPTSIPSLRAALDCIPRPRVLALEEGPLVHWLRRNLLDCVESLIVCDPRRNALINQEGDKDDRSDARKLAGLLRGGYLREVYHSDDGQRVLFKQWVALYHDRVRDAVRQINKIRALCWCHGVRACRAILRDAEVRQEWLSQQSSPAMVAQVELLCLGLDAVLAQVAAARRQWSQLGRRYPILDLWQDLPGVGAVRSATLLAYLDVPGRFGSNPHRLWKYCGVGLDHQGSGKDRNGRMKMGALQLAWRVNRRLKDVVMGQAISAIRLGDNVFADVYERLVRHGLTPSNSRHTVARKMLSVEWGMWKTMTRFDPGLVGPR